MLPESDPYYPREKKWLLEDTGCVPRYLRASKWKLEDAKKRIKGTLEWVRSLFIESGCICSCLGLEARQDVEG